VNYADLILFAQTASVKPIFMSDVLCKQPVVALRGGYGIGLVGLVCMIFPIVVIGLSSFATAVGMATNVRL
jgi:hypothetical protein